MLIGGKYREAAFGCQLFVARKVDSILALVAPWRCILCNEPASGMDLCMPCLEGLPWLRLPAGEQLGTPEMAIAALAYRPPVDGLVTGLKFHGRLAASRVLGELLAIRVQEAWQAGVGRPDVLLPVPLHRARLLRRGYNQAELIAVTLGRVLGLPVRPGWLSRRRSTAPQMELDRRARLAGPAGAFAVPRRQRRRCSGRRIALVDDVLTTGATLAACAAELRHAGAAHVECWAAARALPAANPPGKAIQVSGSNV